MRVEERAPGEALRIGFLAAELGFDNGWARLALETVRHLARLGVRARVLVDRRGIVAASSSFETLPLLPPWPQPPLRWPAAVAAALPRTIRALRGFDLVHCLVEPYLPLAAICALALKKPLVVTAVGTYSARALGPRPWLSPFAFWTRRAAAIPCISGYTEKRVREWNPGAPTSVVNPGVDTTKLSPGAPEGRPASVSGRVVLSVGAVKPRKGYDLAVRALARLGPGFEDVSLYIAGDPSTHAGYVQSLVTLAGELGVGERVHLLGRVGEKELLDWYRRSDVFLLNASNRGGHFEGFGLTLLEANACGKPVIGCLDSGAEDIIRSGDNGLLIPQDDPAATARAISTILGDPAVGGEMGRRGISRASEMSWEQSARKMFDLYRRVVPIG
jgi:glycosyltransferase involved in cell wall biosynthesis